MSDDKLDVFDDLDDGQPDRASHAHTPLAAATQPRRRGTGRFIVVVVVVLALAGLAFWRLAPHGSEKSDDREQNAAAASSRPSASPSPSSTYVDGDGPQAAQTGPKPKPSQVSIPAPKAPDVALDDPDSVTKAWVSAINNRSKDNLDQVQDWTAKYSTLDDLSDIDPYASHGAMDGRAPAVTKDVTTKKKDGAKPVDSSTYRTKTATVTVQSHTGEVTEQTWTVTTGKDGDDWKVTSVSLDEWTGKK